MSIIKCVVPISGGKDSQACLQLALQSFSQSEVIALFCDTGFEHPLTYAHIKTIKDLYGIEVVVRSGGEVLDRCKRWGRFPGGGARFCTSELKIDVSKDFYKELAEKQEQGFEVWYGMRSGESHERATRYENKISDDLYAPHEIMPSNYPQYLGRLGVMFRLPILSWTVDQVLMFLDGKENPLYAAGFDRVGCFPCLAGGDVSKERAFQFDDFGREQYIRVLQVSEEIGKDIFTSKGGSQRNNPDQLCMICTI